MLGAVTVFAANAKADEIRVTAYAVLQQPNAGSTQQFIFSSTFLYDLDTNQLVAGSMSTQVTDTFAGTPYTSWVPKPNFHGPTFTYFDPDLNEVRLLFASPGGPSFPEVGSYPVTDIALTCATFACADHFGPYLLVPVSGELSVGAVPEPETEVLLVCSFMAVALTLALFRVWRAWDADQGDPPIRSMKRCRQRTSVVGKGKGVRSGRPAQRGRGLVIACEIGLTLLLLYLLHSHSGWRQGRLVPAFQAGD